MTAKTFYEDIIEKIGSDNFDRIQKARIGIAGAGGLGSNCAMNLVRVGFRVFTIVDFDIVDPANLDRQFYFNDQIVMNKVEALKENLLRINRDLELKIVNTRVCGKDVEELFGDCDAVGECFDAAESKSMLVSELIKLRKFVVAASGLGGVGSSDRITVHKVKPNLIIIGDLKSDIRDKPALSPRVNVAAAKQADTILEFILQSYSLSI